VRAREFASLRLRDTTTRASSFHFFPLALPFLAALFFIAVAVVTLIEIRLIAYSYEKIGISHRHVFAVLFYSLLGSYVNIPVADLPPERVISNREISFFGMRYVVPEVEEWPRTVVAVNVGGAVIPALLSFYLVVKNKLYGRSILSVAVVSAIVHRLAYPVPGVGIACPTFVPPIVAATVALILSRRAAPVLAYVSGSLGTLIGADLMNLDKVQGLGAPIASIGGAGTFDGIFLTGLLAVLLA
jgi:uncharacterized membrane protein